MKTYRNPITVRGDSLYCPLCLSIDPYWGCEPDCLHCYLRGLNYTWGQDLRAADPEDVRRKLQAGLKNRNPKTPLAHCLAKKKTLRLGNKSDPFQPIEDRLHVSRSIMKVLVELNWSFVIQTRFPARAWRALREVAPKPVDRVVHLMPVISPGLDRDWETFERKKTEPPEARAKVAGLASKKGFPVTINGEPFIPGFHEPKDFRAALRLLKSHEIRSYNTYNFHFTPFVAKRLASVKGVDIERIWYYNQDREWRRILRTLLDIADEEGVAVGCPDFVNSGKDRVEPFNTCCGINVPNPATFNTHHFKMLWQQGLSPDEILERTWDGSGDWEEGRKIVYGTAKNVFTLKDIV